MTELYSTNSVGLRFREVVKKIKERGKKKRIKKIYKMDRKKLAYVQIWGKNSKIL